MACQKAFGFSCFLISAWGRTDLAHQVLTRRIFHAFENRSVTKVSPQPDIYAKREPFAGGKPCRTVKFPIFFGNCLGSEHCPYTFSQFSLRQSWNSWEKPCVTDSLKRSKAWAWMGLAFSRRRITVRPQPPCMLSPKQEMIRYKRSFIRRITWKRYWW